MLSSFGVAAATAISFIFHSGLEVIQNYNRNSFGVLFVIGVPNLGVGLTLYFAKTSISLSLCVKSNVILLRQCEESA